MSLQIFTSLVDTKVEKSFDIIKSFRKAPSRNAAERA